MNFRNLIGICAVALCCAACEKENIYEGTPEQQETTPTEFKINSIISQTEPKTRAPQLDGNGAGTFTTGDKNTLLFLTDAQEVVTSFEYTYGNSYYWSDLQLPADMKSGKVTAWYPAVGTKTPQAFEWNVTKEANPDLLVAAPVAIQTEQESAIQLTFKHKMHKLHVEVVSGDASVTESDLANASITCRNYFPTVSVNLIEGTTGAVSGELQNKTVSNPKADFLLPAQAAGTIEVAVNVKNKTNVFKIAETVINGQAVKELESGKTLSLIITVTKSEMKLTIGTEIDGWENQGEKNDNIII